MKKAKIVLLPLLAMSAMALSSCTKDDISSLFELGDSLAETDSNLQSQIDDLKNEIAGLKSQIASLREEMNGAIETAKADYNSKIDTINQQISLLQQDLRNLQTQLAEDKEAIENDYNTKISNLKTYIDGKVGELNNKIVEDEQALATLKDKHNTDKAALQQDYNAKIDALSTSASEMRQELQNDYNTKITNLTNKLASDKQELFDDYSAKLAVLSESEEEARQALKDDYEAKLEALETKHDSDKEDIEEDYNSKLADLEETFNDGMEELETDYNSKISELNTAFNTAKTNLQEQITTNKDAVDAFKTQYANEKAALELDYNTKINNLRTTYEAKVAEIEANIVLANTAIETLQNELRAQIAMVQADYQSQINALTSRVADLENVEVHTVTFDTLGGSQVESAIVEHGEKVSKPADPTKPGYTFDGWEYEGEPWVFYGYAITEDITLIASWTAIDYIVIFQNDDGSVLETQTPVHYGDSVTYHGEIPVKPNPEDHYIYTFNGWDIDITNITGNTIAIAQYSEEYAPYTAKFLDESNSVIYSTLVREGETATFGGETPTKPSDLDLQIQYQFAGWDEISRTNDEIIYKVHFESCTNGLVFEGNSVYQYTGSSTSVTIPAYWNGFAITNISEQAFESTNVEQVNISSGITSISEWAFANCASLRVVNFPNSMMTIGNNAFQGCSSLNNINLPDGIVSIGNGAFYNCSSLTEITIPDSVTSLGDSVFWNCSSLISATLPNNLTEIYDCLFGGCSSLTEITIPDSVTSIGPSAFTSCGSLESIVIPDSVEYIWYGAFNYCEKLTIYTQREFKPKTWQADWSGDSLVVWGYESNITVGDYTYALSSQNGIKKAALIDYNRSIEHFEVPEEVNGYNLSSINMSIFKYNTTLKTIVLPNCVNVINNQMFIGCSLLESIVIPDGITSIGNMAFYDCSALFEVTIPSSVTYVGDYAFYSRSAIRATFKSVTPPEMGDHIFSGNYDSIIYVPCLGLSSYQNLLSNSNRVEPTHSYSETIVEPTCLANGSRTLTCTDCGHVETTTIPMLDHEWGEWEVVSPASCDGSGLRKRTCSVCGTEETEILTAEHDYQLVDSNTDVAVYKCSRCDAACLGFNTSDLTDESKNRLVFDGDGGARFWGRPIGNALPLLEDGSSINCEDGECVYDKSETGDFFELVFDLTEEQAALLQNCMLYCDAKPASYLNGTDFWAYGRSNEEWTPGYYIDDDPTHLQFESDGVTPVMADVLDENGTPTGEQVQMGKRVSDYRYVLYVDGEVKDFDDSITNPTHGNNSNMIREEFIVPYTFCLHSGTNRISLHMAGGYRSIFYNFTFRSIA